MVLHLDLETYSDVSLQECGVYRYAASPNFEILLLAYAIDGDPVICLDLANGDVIPEKILLLLLDKTVEKWAHNAQFERVCLSAHYDSMLLPEGWYCTMVKALTLGLPPGLDAVGRVLKLKEDKQKLYTGKNLIRKFCVPQKPSKANGMRTRYYKEDLPMEWEDFKTYCIRDVETEREIHKKLDRYPTEKEETRMYWLDQVINDRGVGIEEKLVRSAIQINDDLSNRLTSRFIELTGIDNPNSLQQLKSWIKERTGVEIPSITKETIPQIKQELAAYPDILEVLSIRQQLGKSSIAKYQKMLDMLLPDKRVKGILQFYGGSATGRWAGRGVQVQNLPQNKIADLDTAREVVLTGDLDLVEMLYDNVPSILSQLIRTAFVPREGYRYIIADFNAIEGRVLPWLADEDWRNELFRSGGKLYETSASRMFNVPVERIVHGNPEYALRAKGKVAELACIAEGQLVLTDCGEKPIETVQKTDNVWDGAKWVSHGGVVFKGTKEVITYEGLTATADHLVWTEGSDQPIRFGIAAAGGARLRKSGPDWAPIRKCEGHQRREEVEGWMEGSYGPSPMPALRGDKLGALLQPEKRKVKRLPTVFAAEENTKVARSAVYVGETALPEPKGPRVQKLRRKGDRIPVYISFSRRLMDDRAPWSSGPIDGIRPNRRQRPLRTGKPKMGNTPGKLSKPTKVYDIINCGPTHRFTVSGVLVHNCGYGGGAGALVQMGALNQGLREVDLPEIISQWRAQSPNIVKFWRTCENAAKEAVRDRTTVTIPHGIQFIYEPGILFIQLPSRRRIAYFKPKLEPGDMGLKLTYEGRDDGVIGGESQRLETYGGKICENIVQATARDCLRDALLWVEAAGYKTVMHIHDEVVIEAQGRQGSLQEILDIMALPLPWAPGLILKGAGFEANYYQKD